MVRKILSAVPDKVLLEDLERYCQMALELGATDAKVISAEDILIDERVRAKCIYPKCRSYGTNANCPPYSMDLDQVRKTVSGFKYAVFIKTEVPSEMVAGKEARKKLRYASTAEKNYEIVSKIEAQAFYDGYYLALGFAGGPCKNVFCPDIECSALLPGKGCRHPLRARGSMEGVGMDAFRMAARAGWDVYPIGGSTSPSEVPYGVRLGLVLID
ncbi:DUF2284 domain-containing protein [Chloroflexota bacterium]